MGQLSGMAQGEGKVKMLTVQRDLGHNLWWTCLPAAPPSSQVLCYNAEKWSPLSVEAAGDQGLMGPHPSTGHIHILVDSSWLSRMWSVSKEVGEVATPSHRRSLKAPISIISSLQIYPIVISLKKYL